VILFFSVFLATILHYWFHCIYVRLSHIIKITYLLTYLNAQGRHLQRASRLVDFDITLGDYVCVPVSLTDNQVDCRPPTNRPNKNINDTFCQDDTLSLHVGGRHAFHSHQFSF